MHVISKSNPSNQASQKVRYLISNCLTKDTGANANLASATQLSVLLTQILFFNLVQITSMSYVYGRIKIPLKFTTYIHLNKSLTIGNFR